MLDINDINKTITQLENGSTSFDNCMKLASLYIVRDKYNIEETQQDSVEKEYHDILPSYKRYCNIKRNYQLHKTTKDEVIDCINDVSREIKEFLLIIYRNTDSQEERDILYNSILGCCTEMRGK